KAAQNGLMAAQMALNGFTASVDCFEGKYNFFRTINGSDNYQTPDFTQIGKKYALLEHGLNIKRYPSCSLSHRSIDNLLNILSQQVIEPETVERIICRATPRALNVLFHTKISDPLQGK